MSRSIEQAEIVSVEKANARLVYDARWYYIDSDEED